MLNRLVACLLFLSLYIAYPAPVVLSTAQLAQLPPDWSYRPGSCPVNTTAPWRSPFTRADITTGPTLYCLRLSFTLDRALSSAPAILLPPFKGDSPYPLTYRTFLDGQLLQRSPYERAWYAVTVPKPRLLAVAPGVIAAGPHHLDLEFHDSRVLHPYIGFFPGHPPVTVGEVTLLRALYASSASSLAAASLPLTFVAILAVITAVVLLAWWGESWRRGLPNHELLVVAGIVVSANTYFLLQFLWPDWPESVFWTTYSLLSATGMLLTGLLIHRWVGMPLSSWSWKLYITLLLACFVIRLGLIFDSPTLFLGPVLTISISAVQAIHLVVLIIRSMLHQPANWLILTTILSFLGGIVCEFKFNDDSGFYPIAVLLLILAMVQRALEAHGRRELDNLRMESEMHAGQQVQRYLLPGTASGSLSPISWQARYVAAQELGGDFYYIDHDADSCTIVIGDVSGKGVAAAIAVSFILAQLERRPTGSPAQLLNWLNGVVSGRFGGGFITILALVAHKDGSVRFANAGHPPACSSRGYLTAPPHLPLGIDSQIRYQDYELLLAPGSVLYAFTDGVVEAGASSGQLLGFDRLEQDIRTGASSDDLIASATRLGPVDDMTIVELRYA